MYYERVLYMFMNMIPFIIIYLFSGVYENYENIYKSDTLTCAILLMNDTAKREKYMYHKC